MKKVTGTIFSVSDKGDKFGINIKGVWYNGLTKIVDMPEKGENVEVEYDETKAYHAIKSITKIKDIQETIPEDNPIQGEEAIQEELKPTPGHDPDAITADDHSIRAQALNAAAKLVASIPYDLDPSLDRRVKMTMNITDRLLKYITDGNPQFS